MKGDSPVLLSVIAIVVCLLASLCVEPLLRPRPLAPWRRTPTALAQHVGVVLAVYLFELAVFRRPWFATVVVLVFFGILILINNVKMTMLREPFIVQDFAYFTDALRHPRLYIPFLGYPRLLLATGAFAAAVAGGMALEAPLTDAMSGARFALMLAVLAASTAAVLWRATLTPAILRYVPQDDLRQRGLLSCLLCYAVAEWRPLGSSDDPLCTLAAAMPGSEGNLVLIQSESFFDARALYPGIRAGVLRRFDALGMTAMQRGALRVPAWGANTVRTEFAVLSGRPQESLGVHRFNPYRRLARSGITTLASILRARGYRTVCVHPYAAAFYGRDRVMPLLGFDELIDATAFTAPSGDAPYVGDIAVAERIALELSHHDLGQPVFLFVITMENHGPLHLESVADGDVARLYSTPPPPGCDDLTCYLRHQLNADRMLDIVVNTLRTMATPGVLGFYGDHVPIMPQTYSAIGEPSAATPYLVWRSTDVGVRASSHDIDADELAGVLLRALAEAGQSSRKVAANFTQK